GTRRRTSSTATGRAGRPETERAARPCAVPPGSSRRRSARRLSPRGSAFPGFSAACAVPRAWREVTAGTPGTQANCSVAGTVGEGRLPGQPPAEAEARRPAGRRRQGPAPGGAVLPLQPCRPRLQREALRVPLPVAAPQLGLHAEEVAALRVALL